MDPGNYAS